MTPEQFQALYALRVAQLPAAIKRGTRNVLAAVDREQMKNLTGSGDPGSYPIPIRTGNLRNSRGFRMEPGSDTVGYVFNKASYAPAIHEGTRHYRGRPFLDDAADQVDTGLIFRRGVARALGLPA